MKRARISPEKSQLLNEWTYIVSRCGNVSFNRTSSSQNVSTRKRIKFLQIVDGTLKNLFNEFRIKIPPNYFVSPYYHCCYALGYHHRSAKLSMTSVSTQQLRCAAVNTAQHNTAWCAAGVRKFRIKTYSDFKQYSIFY
jgi:hypothetical protein